MFDSGSAFTFSIVDVETAHLKCQRTEEILDYHSLG